MAHVRPRNADRARDDAPESRRRPRALHAALGPGLAVEAGRTSATRTTPRTTGACSGKCSTSCMRAGIPVPLTLYGSPRWANGGGGPNVLPTSGFGDFATAAARGSRGSASGPPGTSRTPGSSRRPSRRAPTSRRCSTPLTRRCTPRPARTASPAGSRRRARRRRAWRRSPSFRGCAPRTRGSTPTRRTPTRSAAARRRPVTPARRAATSRWRGWRRSARTSRAPSAPKPIWLTEYGYQTNPPDRLLGVSEALQAKYIGAAALRVWQERGVTMLIQFLVRDEPDVGHWQSGLFSAGGAAKPSYHAFALPLAQVSRHGSQRRAVGPGAPGLGRAHVRAPARRGRQLAGDRRHGTDERGRRLHAHGGASARDARPHPAPAVGWASPPLTVS